MNSRQALVLVAFVLTMFAMWLVITEPAWAHDPSACPVCPVCTPVTVTVENPPMDPATLQAIEAARAAMDAAKK